MTTQATTIGGTGTRLRPSLEELVDRLMAALFRAEPETAAQAETPSVARGVHEARRLRQAGDLDGALAVFAGVDTARAETREARWAYAEWTDLVRRRFGDRDAPGLQPGRGTGRRPHFPGATGRLRSRRCWGCAGSRARPSRGAACGVCGP